MKERTIFSRTQALALAKAACSAADLSSAAAIIRTAAEKLPAYTIRDGKRRTCAWKRDLLKLADALESGTTAFAIMSPANQKLEFWQFSTLPLITCPGAGACKNFCYSLKAWRNSGPFCRQLQNTLLLKHRPGMIRAAFLALPKDIWFRLYVDGDFDSIRTMGFWFRLLTQRQDITCWGYSKSWDIFLSWQDQGLAWPQNYTLNISSGSIHDGDPEMKRRMLELPVTRGEFIAVNVKFPVKGFKRYEHPEYHRMVRAAINEERGEKGFSCTGKCHDCVSDGPICGLINLKLPIGIGTH